MKHGKYIHYGSKEFKPDRFEKIKNLEYGSKPRGGLWASPVDAAYGWKDWNETEQLKECSTDNSFTFTLTDTARVLVLDSVEKLFEIGKYLPDAYKERFSAETEAWMYVFDWEELSARYDAVEYCLSRCHSLYFALYGWDCDSILILNPQIIKTT